MVKQLAQVHTVKWQSQDLKAGNIVLESTTQSTTQERSTTVKFQNTLEVVIFDFFKKTGVYTMLLVHSEPHP